MSKPPELRTFDDSPDAGPDCLCSWCDKPILEGPVVRMWVDELNAVEVRFHIDCSRFVLGTLPKGAGKNGSVSS